MKNDLSKLAFQIDFKEKEINDDEVFLEWMEQQSESTNSPAKGIVRYHLQNFEKAVSVLSQIGENSRSSLAYRLICLETDSLYIISGNWAEV